MLVSDLFIQGVRGFSPQLRLRFGAGYTAVQPVGDARLGALWRLIWYSEGFDPNGEFNGELGADRGARAGVLFQTADGARWRVMRELATGAAQLARFDNGQFAPVSSSPADIAQYLRGQLKVPGSDVFDAIFSLRPESFPSKRVGAAGTSALPALTAPPPPSAPSLGLALPKSMPNAARQGEIRPELARLKELREGARQVKALEFEVDGLQKQKFAIEDRMNKRKALVAKVDELDRSLAQVAGLASLGDDFEELIVCHDRAKKKRDDDRARLQEELRALEQTGAPPFPDPLHQDRKFLAGVGVGTLFLAAAFVLQGQWRFLGLLDLAAFGLAAMQALGVVNDLEAIERFRNRNRVMAERQKKVDAVFETETAVVRGAMERFDLERAGDLLDMMARRGQLQREHAQAKAAVAAYDQASGTEALREEAAKIAREIQAIEDRLAAVSLAGDVRDLDRAIGALEAELRGEPAPGAASSHGEESYLDYGNVELGAESTPKVDPVATTSVEQRLIVALAESTGGDPAQAAAALSKRAADYLGRFLAQPGLALAIDEVGVVRIKGRPASTLPLAEQDAAYLALRLAAFELAAGRQPFPLWIERLHTMPQLPHQVIPAYLKHVAKRAQVLQAVPDAQRALGADAVVLVQES